MQPLVLGKFAANLKNWTLDIHSTAFEISHEQLQNFGSTKTVRKKTNILRQKSNQEMCFVFQQFYKKSHTQKKKHAI